MHCRRIAFLMFVLGMLVMASGATFAADGQKDLDQATELQLSAESLGDLEKVADLCESAIKKGLSKDDEAFAQQLMSSALLRRAERFAGEIISRQGANPRWPQLREAALKDLQRLLKYDDANPEAQLLVAKLNTLPEGDRDAARKAIDRAIDLLADDKEKLSGAYILRARMLNDPKQQLADLDKSIEASPSNTEAWETRALLYVARGELDKAVEDFNKLLESDATNLAVRLAIVEALVNMQKFDDAQKHIDRAIEQEPNQAVTYALRARVRIGQDKPQEALDDLNEAVRLQPGNPATLLLRAGLRHDLDDLKGAKEDLNQVLQAAPGARQALLLRSMISAEEGKMVDAIADIESLLKLDPKNVELRMQLAVYYAADERPRRAIEVLDAVIKDEPENWLALRSRGDTLLSVGKHAKAVEDYERALKLKDDDSGLLNNLAWVMATSPDDDVRNGKQAIELATRACEVTDFKRPHILSTLASAYAEAGDFDKAKEWSKKAVELGKEQGNEQIDQLQKELESYEQGKPWRERQEVQEKPAPLKSSGALET
ncbi:MAG: tetratricopeptide repeat protein [Planctomycetales bacterium]|nr:tetratricopeptide repeat protein [Planctomycetales bacterium]